MEFKNKASGVIYHVVNPKLVAYYEKDERFEKVAEKKAPEKKEAKK